MGRFRRDRGEWGCCPECGTRIDLEKGACGCPTCGQPFDPCDPLPAETADGGNPATIGFDDAERVKG